MAQALVVRTQVPPAGHRRLGRFARQAAERAEPIYHQRPEFLRGAEVLAGWERRAM